MKETFLTQRGPKAVGPYSTAVKHNGTVYLSGMIPIDPAVGKIVEEDVSDQARRVFSNIVIVLEEMGLNTADILKIGLFITDMADFGAINAIYAEYFGPDYPARSCVQVAALPMGAKVEAEVTAQTMA